MSVKHMNQIDLARRWSISPRTLERWRWVGEGPRFVKLGGRVRYRLEDVEAYEAQQVRASTAETGALPAPESPAADFSRDGGTGRARHQGAAA